MQTEARVGVVVEGGQRALNSAHGGVAVNGTARKLAQQQKSLHQQSQIGTVPQLLAGGIDGALSKTCTAPLARLTILLQRYYLAAGKELMRINGTTKSFVASYLAESIAGAMTIRAFGEEDRHFSKNLGFIDMHASPFFYSFTANEWLILRLEILCAIVLSSSALALTLLNTSASKSGLIGMALSYGLSLNVYLVFSVQNQCHLANMIVSVERLEQYMNIPSEAPKVIESNQPPLSWPAIGEVEICNLKVRYQPNAPFVLQGISCKFRGGEKIGIVGRTGSGKTTLIST